MADPEGVEAKFLFLVSASYKALPSNCIKLRSYMNINSANLTESSTFKLPKAFSSKIIACQYCYFPWTQGINSFKLLPFKKLKRSERSRILKEKTKDGDNENKNTSHNRNELVVQCKVCSKKSKFSLPKQKKKLNVKDDTLKTPKKCKKKNKKDKTCGLKKVLIPSTEMVDDCNYIPLSQNNKSSQVPNKSSTSKEKQKNYSPVAKLQEKKKKEESKNLSINPFATKFQNKMSYKSKQKLQQLKNAVKEDKGSVKNTLKGFLSLIS